MKTHIRRAYRVRAWWRRLAGEDDHGVISTAAPSDVLALPPAPRVYDDEASHEMRNMTEAQFAKMLNSFGPGEYTLVDVMPSAPPPVRFDGPLELVFDDGDDPDRDVVLIVRDGVIDAVEDLCESAEPEVEDALTVRDWVERVQAGLAQAQYAAALEKTTLELQLWVELAAVCATRAEVIGRCVYRTQTEATRCG